MKQAWQDFSRDFADRWNTFWFTPLASAPLVSLRFLVGLLAVYFLLSHIADLEIWFGRNGLLPVETVQQLIAAQDEAANSPFNSSPGFDSPTASLFTSSFHWSYLNYVRNRASLWSVHLVAIVISLLFTLGYSTRWTAPATLVIILSYVHRAPQITGPFESVLTMLLAYLSLALVGPDAGLGRPTVWGNVGWRLMQLHVAALYLLMALSQLGGTVGAEYEAAWWRGEALWWLITRSESRLVDLSGWHSPAGTLLVNAGTHLVIATELALAILLWKPLLRPLLLVLATLFWLGLGLVTGWVSYAVAMWVATLVFLPTDYWPFFWKTVLRGVVPGVPAGRGAAAAENSASHP
jgi:hypothetical protein